VERRAQESQGNFSIFTLRILEGKRQELNISPEEANVIKEEVLKPYKEYERKLYEYEQTLIEAVEKHYPFSETLQKEIKEYQQYLGLMNEDIAAIEKRVFAPKQAEYERQQEAERLKREQELAEYQQQLRQQEKDKKRRQQEQEAQQRLQREQEEAKKRTEEYKHKVRRYKEEFFKAVEVKYPLNESIRNQLKDFQQFLGLSDEDVALIEKPILDEKELEEQQKVLQQEEDKKRRQPAKEEANKNSQEYYAKVQRYKQEFLQAVETKYPLNKWVRNRLQNLQQFLGLNDEDVAEIEKLILDEKGVEKQEKSQRSQRQEYQENLRQKQKLRQQQQHEKDQIPRKQGKQQKFQKQQLNSRSTWGASKSTWLTIIAGFILGALLTFTLNWLLLHFGIYTLAFDLPLYMFTGGCLGGLYVSKKILK
jgi:hypothetical protein